MSRKYKFHEKDDAYPAGQSCNFEQKNKQMNFKNNTLNKIHYNFYF